MATVVKGDQKAPFSIATTPRCRGRVPLLSLYCSTLPLIHTLYSWMLSKEVSSTIFKVFGMTWPGIEPGSPGPLANTLLSWPMAERSDTKSNVKLGRFWSQLRVSYVSSHTEELKILTVIIVIKHLQINQTLALNNP